MKAKDTGAIVWGGLLAAVAVGAVWLGFALLPDRSTGPALTGQMRTFDTAQAPEAAPDISFSDALGNSLDLEDFRGHVVLVNLWATWCAPCVREMPALDRLQRRLAQRGLVVIPISIDREGIAAVAPFYEEHGLDALGVYLDPPGQSARAFATPGLPATYLIDRDGLLIGTYLGPAEWDGDDAVRLIEYYLDSEGA
ncbi:MAG: TlpA disulfide reductase family protein [Inquilinaceae bacterium]